MLLKSGNLTAGSLTTVVATTVRALKVEPSDALQKDDPTLLPLNDNNCLESFKVLGV